MPQSSVLETIQAQSDSANDNANNKPQPRKHPNTKRTGELAEAAFVVNAASLGYAVSKPWGDSERYDFILDSGPRTWRVQIKCTESLNANGYQVQSTYTDQKKKGHYTSEDIDVLVAYILPLNLWYVVPANAFPASASLRFYPEGNISGRRPRFEQYREAWHLFQQDVGPDDVGSASVGPASVGPGLRPGKAERSSAARTPPATDPPGPDTQPVTDATPAPETPMERMMTQWAQRVHSLYNRKR
jgi:hypothetical protein